MSELVRPELTCKEVVELLTDHLENRLTSVANERFERHVRGCTGCRAYVGQMRALVRAAGRLAAANLPAATREGLLRVYRAWRQTRTGAGPVTV